MPEWCLLFKPLIQFHSFSVLQLTWLCRLISYLCCTVHLLCTNNRMISVQKFLKLCSLHWVHCSFYPVPLKKYQQSLSVVVHCSYSVSIILCERLREGTKFVVSLEIRIYPEFYSFIYLYF